MCQSTLELTHRYHDMFFCTCSKRCKSLPRLSTQNIVIVIRRHRLNREKNRGLCGTGIFMHSCKILSWDSCAKNKDKGKENFCNNRKISLGILIFRKARFWLAHGFNDVIKSFIASISNNGNYQCIHNAHLQVFDQKPPPTPPKTFHPFIQFGIKNEACNVHNSSK